MIDRALIRSPRPLAPVVHCTIPQVTSAMSQVLTEVKLPSCAEMMARIFFADAPSVTSLSSNSGTVGPPVPVLSAFPSNPSAVTVAYASTRSYRVALEPSTWYTVVVRVTSCMVQSAASISARNRVSRASAAVLAASSAAFLDACTAVSRSTSDWSGRRRLLALRNCASAAARSFFALFCRPIAAVIRGFRAVFNFDFT
jgi:hypothetical protein